MRQFTASPHSRGLLKSAESAPVILYWSHLRTELPFLNLKLPAGSQFFSLVPWKVHQINLTYLQ